ncbi:unnamed protein product [Paramecium sonneborni]|uniref:Protein kinase domain-containing protein n=1 Tax=Paramecium sonneborni TaxID=65129 RepID=A0A8S1QC16_9CILI|nr:unnamed protein product [Paramecium sonneborni]
MEYADGAFKDFMKTDEFKQLSQDQINKFFIQMVKGVQSLHKLGLFHRDLKPENFVYINKPNKQKIIKLIDFGQTRNTEISDVLKTNQVGTPQYQAPEIFTGQYDNEIDIWSLGLIWWEMLTNELFLKSIKEKKFLYSNQQNIDSKIDTCKSIQRKENNLLKKILNLEAQKEFNQKKFSKLIINLIQNPFKQFNIKTDTEQQFKSVKGEKILCIKQKILKLMIFWLLKNTNKSIKMNTKQFKQLIKRIAVIQLEQQKYFKN